MGKRILVIDDDEFVRKSFSLSLKKIGDGKVDTANSGEEGIELENIKEYDIIFLDLKMPGLNGVETLQKLRKMDVKSKIYIVTAFEREFVDELANAADSELEFEVLRKPLDSNQIVLAAKSEGAIEMTEV